MRFEDKSTGRTLKDVLLLWESAEEAIGSDSQI